MAVTLLLQRRFARLLKLRSSSSIPKYRSFSALLVESSIPLEYTTLLPSPSAVSSGSFCSRPSLNLDGDSQSPAAIDFRGPSRFDWDCNAQAWVYRRTKAKLMWLLEAELEQLRGEPIDLS